jgi:hypothetical protein
MFQHGDGVALYLAGNQLEVSVGKAGIAGCSPRRFCASHCRHCAVSYGHFIISMHQDGGSGRRKLAASSFDHCHRIAL